MDVRERLGELPSVLFIKWLSVPYAIMTIIISGVSYNLYSYFQLFGKIQGYGEFTQVAIKTTVLFGYYFGFLPGLIIKWTSPATTFIISSFATLVSFVTLAYMSQLEEGGGFQWFLMLFMLFIGSMSGSFATITSIVSTVLNFPRMLGYVVMAILIGYYKAAPYFEFSVRVTFFKDTDYFWYFIGLGTIVSLVQFSAAFAIRTTHIDDKFQNLMKDQDNTSLLMFAVVEIIFFGAFYISSIMYEQWHIGAYCFFAVIVINFIVLIFSAILIYNRITRMRSRSITLRFPKLSFKNILFFEYLKEIKFMCLLASTFIVIGVTSTYTYNIFQTAIGKSPYFP
jgi:hypothetical protein